jgi:hypothetical protein
MITGGGQNPLAGVYGMAEDYAVAFRVVTADSRFITVSETENSDLFWALRGGGGGIFAVITSVIIRAHPKLNVVTSKWVSDTSANSIGAFWDGTKEFCVSFELGRRRHLLIFHYGQGAHAIPGHEIPLRVETRTRIIY